MQPFFQRPVHQLILPAACLFFCIRGFLHLCDRQRAVLCFLDKLLDAFRQRFPGRQMLVLVCRRAVVVKINIPGNKILVRHIVHPVIVRRPSGRIAGIIHIDNRQHRRLHRQARQRYMQPSCHDKPGILVLRQRILHSRKALLHRGVRLAVITVVRHNADLKPAVF